MIIKISAIDTLFFRDGRPFSSEDNWADSLNYPSLSTIYGAIRSAYFSQNGLDFKEANSDKDITKNLKINGLYFYDEKNRYFLFKSPEDLYIFKEKAKLFNLVKNKYSSNRLDFIFEAKNDDIEKKEVFLGNKSFKDYVTMAKKEFNFFDTTEFFSDEFKIGIGLNKNIKSIEEGKIYRIGAKRYKNLSIVVDFEGIELSKKGLLKLGGENKGVYYEEFKNINIQIEKISSDIFKIYLLTPAIFKNGWCPDFLDKNLEGEINKVKVKLIAAAIGKEKYIGGWDIKKNSPKTMYKAVPEGSVYYFKVLNGLKSILIENIMSDCFLEYKKQGYGKVMVCDYREEL